MSEIAVYPDVPFCLPVILRFLLGAWQAEIQIVFESFS